MLGKEGTESVTLYDDGQHKFIFLAWEEREEESIVQTNQYLIIDGNEAMLLDPGGAHVFPRVLANVLRLLNRTKLNIYSSHIKTQTLLLE